MKAIVIRQFGTPDVMRLEEFAEPKAALGEIVIKVHSVSVNRTLDCIVRASKIRAISHRKMALNQAAEAHRIVENNQIIGKMVLEPEKG